MSTNDCQELRECPFCGGEASKRLYVRGRYAVHCNLCNARRDPLYDTEAEAIEAWNTRTERTCRITSEEYDDLLEYTVTRFSCGHSTIGGAAMFKYCPECGAKVVEE